MEKNGRLNIDASGAISDLKYALKQVRVKTRRYKIFFRGKSFEFDGYRPYTSEDDASSVDWKASKRSDKLLVKQYKEEENMKILFVIDIGENMVLGSGSKLKCEYAAEIVLALFNMFITSGNKVGYVLFGDKVNSFALPSMGINNFHIFLDLLSSAEIYKGKSRLDSAIDFVLENFDTSLSAVVLVSDFAGFNKKTEPKISLLSSKFETLAFMIKDPLDRTLPDIKGEFVLEDPKTGQQIVVEPRLAKISYERNALKQEEFVKTSFKNNAIDLLSLSTNEVWVEKVTNFMKQRAEKGGST